MPLLMHAFDSNAQPDDFLKGYLVVGTDSIHGYIGVEKDPWNLSMLYYKTKPHRKAVQKYNANDIKAFFIEPADELYIKHAVEIENTPFIMRTLEKVPQLTFKNDTVFLRKLVGGALGLYSYRDNKEHFFAMRNDSLIELMQIRFVPFGGNQNDPFIINRYRKALDTMTGDCIPPSMSNALFREGPIVKTVAAYNHCKSDINYLRTKGKPYFNVTLLGGLATNQAKFTGASNTIPPPALYYASNTTFSTPSTTLFGGSFDFSLRMKAAVKLNAELIFRSTSNFTASNNETNVNKIRRDYTINLSYTGVNIGFKTRAFKIKDVAVYIQGNYVKGISSNIDSYEVQNIFSTETRYSPMAHFDNSGSGFLGALGVSYWRLHIQMRWETITFPATEPSSITQTSLSFLAGLSLK
jgi:hypothetical protein